MTARASSGDVKGAAEAAALPSAAKDRDRVMGRAQRAAAGRPP